MALEIPRSRLGVRQIQTQKRAVPLEQIIAVHGQSPVATGLDTLGATMGQVLQRRAELQAQGQQLARLEQLSGQPEGAYAGLDPATAAGFTGSLIKSQATSTADSFTPEQVVAINSGDPTKLAQVFPKGIPEKAVTLSQAGTRLSNADNERDARREDRLSSAAISYWKTLETNPVIKKLKDQDIGLGQVDSLVPLIQSGNTIASNAIGAKMARGMGEVGVLTEEDVARYVQSGQLTRSAADKLSRMLRGVPTEATMTEMTEITTALRDSYQNKIQPLYNDAAVRFARNYKLSPEEAAERLVIPYTGLKAIKAPKPTTIVPKKVGRFQIEVE